MKKLILLSIVLIHGLLTMAQKSIDTIVSSNEKILEIEYYESGTETGGQTTMTIIRDSISYQEDNQTNKTKSNNDKDWFKLLSEIKLAKFDKIISATPVADVDGIDTRICIETSKKKYIKFINSTNYKPIKKMLTLLLKEMKNFNNNVNVNYYY